MTYRALIAVLQTPEHKAKFVRTWSPWFHRLYPNYWRYQRAKKQFLLASKWIAVGDQNPALDQHADLVTITDVTQIFK